MIDTSVVKNHHKLFFLGIAISLIAAFMPMMHLAPILIAMAGILTMIVFIRRDTQEGIFLSEVFFLSFISRILASLLMYNFVFVKRGVGLLGDGWGYSENGYSILQAWLSGARNTDIIAAYVKEISPSGALGSFDFWNAIVYYFTDKSPLSVIFINCLAGSLTVIAIYYISRQLYNEKAAKISAILTAFWPSLFMWSIQNLKEPLSIFLIVILVWIVVQLKVKFRFYLLFCIILSSIALKELRVVPFIMFYTVIFPISLILFLWKKNRVLFIFLLLLAGAGLFIVINNYLSQERTPLEYINYMRTVRTYGRTAFLSNLDLLNNPASFIFFLPVALLIAWLAPFPWQMGSMSQIMAIPEMGLYYLLLPAVFSGWRFIINYKMKDGGIICVYIFIMMLVLAFVEGNIGTLFRHRAMVLPFMFILIGIGLDKMKLKITAHN